MVPEVILGLSTSCNRSWKAKWCSLEPRASSKMRSNGMPFGSSEKLRDDLSLALVAGQVLDLVRPTSPRRSCMKGGCQANQVLNAAFQERGKRSARRAVFDLCSPVIPLHPRRHYPCFACPLHPVSNTHKVSYQSIEA